MGTGILQPTHIIFLAILAVLLFGAKRLPEIGRSLGNGMREFKDSVSSLNEVTDAVHSVNEVRTAVKPSNVAAAVIPGVKDVQETMTAAKSLANPLATPEAADSTAAAVEPTTAP
jgi:sec-independent protein translocase protein TatA